jgi:signal transduction histidine kinase
MSHRTSAAHGGRRLRGLRARFLLIVLGGVIVPLTLTAVWLGWSVRRSGEQLVEQRLQRQLVTAAGEVGTRWVGLRSELLGIAEHAHTRAVLDGAALDTTAFGDRWTSLPDAVLGIAISGADVPDRADVMGADAARNADESRNVDVTLRADVTRRLTSLAMSPPMLPVRLVIHDADDGRVLGTLHVRLRADWLLPTTFGAGPGGSLPALFTSDGTPVLPPGLDAGLFLQPRFRLDDDDWLARQHRLHEPPLVLALAAPLSPHAPFTDAARRGMIALLLVIGAGSALLLVFTHRITAPLGRLTEAAEAVARGRLERTVTEQGVDEVRRLGRAFNAMTESLRRLVRRVAQQEAAAAVGEFAASLAHEVRNPLTSVRLDVERARERSAGADTDADALLARALQQLDRLDATVSGALRIARSGNLQLEPVDLRAPITTALDGVSNGVHNRRARIAPWLPPDDALCVMGNAAAIEQLLLNLLLNAVDATDDDGTVSVLVHANAESIDVAIRDDGRGMSAHEVARAAEPFYTTRPDGTGLGLTVVRRIAAAHGAELAIESEPGRGTVVTVTFPRVAAEVSESGTQPARDGTARDGTARHGDATAPRPAAPPGSVATRVRTGTERYDEGANAVVTRST